MYDIKKYQALQTQLKQCREQLEKVTKTSKEQEKILLEAEDYLENIFFQSSMLLNLINDMLDLAKMETFNFEFNENYFNLSE